MDRLLNSLKFHSSSQDQSSPVGRWGIVTGSNGATVKVRLQPEDVQTDWLPLLSSTVGGGWGMVHIPPNGTQVFCIPDCGDTNNYVVVGATWSVKTPVPAAAQGEIWLVHSTGSAIKLTNDGHVSIADAGGCSLAFTNNGTATLTGSLLVTGDITDLNGTHGTVGAFRTAYVAHKHPGVQTGSGTTSTTDHIV
jgi:phage baseplate assembly protein V